MIDAGAFFRASTVEKRGQHGPDDAGGEDPLLL
jgi:hypothetical protein